VNLGVRTLNLGATGSGTKTTVATGSNIGAPNYFGNPSGDVWFGLPLSAGTLAVSATTCECVHGTSARCGDGRRRDGRRTLPSPH
jgi:hypothetical protein